MKLDTIGFLGFGKAAVIFAEDLKNAGLKTVYAYDKFWNKEPFAKSIHEDAKRLGVELVSSPEELAQKTKVVLSMVIPAAAEEAAESIAGFLPNGTIFLDLNSTAPMTKQRNFAAISTANPDVVYIDGCILGAVTESRLKTPILLCGSSAKGLKGQLEDYGLIIKVVEGSPGDASAVKMIRSVFMKGLEVLFVEALHAAKAYNIEKNVLETIKDTFETLTFDQLVNMLITSHSIHAKRRQGEMAEVIETLDAKHIDSTMSKATYEKLGWSADLNLKECFNNQMPKDLNLVISAILEKASHTEPGCN